MIRVLILTIFSLLSLTGSDIEILSQEEVKYSKEILIKDALKHKNYKTAMNVAISLVSTARSLKYTGNSKALLAYGFGVIEIIHKKGILEASLFISLNQFKRDKNLSKRIAFESITMHQNTINDKTPMFSTLSLLYASHILDENSNLQKKDRDLDDLNFALSALQMGKNDIQTDFYTALILNTMGSIKMANIYLGSVCNNNNLNSQQILSYCNKMEVAN